MRAGVTAAAGILPKASSKGLNRISSVRTEEGARYDFLAVMRSRAIVAGTRTKSGSTNFLRLHVLGEHNQEGVRFFAPHEDETLPSPESETTTTRTKHASPKPAKSSTRRK